MHCKVTLRPPEGIMRFKCFSDTIAKEGAFPPHSCAPSPEIGIELHFHLTSAPGATCVQDKGSSVKKHPNPPAWGGHEEQDAGDLGQPNSKVHPGRALSWPIGIVNEGRGGRTALCSPWLQLPTSVTCYFSQAINPIQPRLPGDRGDNPPRCRGGEGEVKGSLQRTR